MTKLGLMVYGFCRAGATRKVDLTFGNGGVELEYVSCLKTNQMKHLLPALIALNGLFAQGQVDWDLRFSDDVMNVAFGEEYDFLTTRTSVFRSVAGMNEWIECNWTLGIVRDGTSVLNGLSWNNERLVVAALDNGYFMSEDLGESFVQTGPTGFGCGSESILHLDEGELVATMGGFQRGLWKCGQSPSTNWSRNYSVGADQRDIQQVGEDLFAVSHSGNHPGGILQSSDYGGSWQLVFGTQYAGNPSSYVILENTLIFISWDGVVHHIDMTTWSELTSFSSAIVSPSDMLEVEGVLFLTSWDGGVYRSEDLGQSWEDIGPNNSSFYKLVLQGDELFAAGETGLWTVSAPGFSSGCTDPEACNYNSFAVEDDGSCAYPAYGQDCNGDCAGGTAWHVDGNASEADATGEAVAPFATIQAAADVACEGDTIFVAPGVYLENVSLTQSHVVLTGYAYSEVSEPIAEQVIIDGGELGTTLFVSGEYTELAHLTIQNGRSGFGAGLYLDGSHHSWIHDCVIRDNVGTGDITAHGIQLGASHCVIEDCLVTGNYGRKHTINAGGSDNVIRNCRIVDNTAWETGGGIVAYTDRMLIENCLIANNEGGGITTYNDNTVVDHCTVTGNGGFGFFIWCLDDADMYVSNTVASGNGSTEVKIQQTGNQVGTFHVRNSLIEEGVDYEWTSVYKVIDSDASLLELSPNLTDDYTLSSISPAIGHGTDFRYDFDGLLEGEGSVEDLSGDARPQPSGTMPDLGCFEHPLGMPEPTFGCTDSSACNYEAGVTDDDGSCIFPTCDDITACNYDPDAVCGGGVCIPSGCLEPEACNFNPNAECEGEMRLPCYLGRLLRLPGLGFCGSDVRCCGVDFGEKQFGRSRNSAYLRHVLRRLDNDGVVAWLTCLSTQFGPMR